MCIRNLCDALLLGQESGVQIPTVACHKPFLTRCISYWTQRAGEVCLYAQNYCPNRQAAPAKTSKAGNQAI
jgi:hypothetical protein